MMWFLMHHMYKLAFSESPIMSQKISNHVYVFCGPLELSSAPFCIS